MVFFSKQFFKHCLILGISVVLNILPVYQSFSQVLFTEDCFIGGVTTTGMDNIGSGYNWKCPIKWEEGYTLRAAYALTYRYGRPAPFSMIVNGAGVNWNNSNQAGPEQTETSPATDYFASHAQNITNDLVIENDTLIIDSPDQQFYLEEGPNWGWWGVYVIILYESPQIGESICTRIYVADQNQVTSQNYEFTYPEHLSSTPVVFGIHSSRLSGFDGDESRILINNQTVGEINGPDSVTPIPSGGVQGHYFYQNSYCEGLNSDIANNLVEGQDGVAIINEYLDSDIENQSLKLFRVEPSPFGGGNPHPSFNITYTPTCTVSNQEMPRSYSFCKSQSTPLGESDITDTIQLNAIPGYDHYEWTPASGLSNSTIANPMCYADSSGWYRVRMWNDDEDGVCAQTIPVFITVGKVPRPGNLQVRASFCPQNTGRIIFGEMAGKSPFQYTVNGTTKTNATFENLAPGTYDVSVTDALGCTWDSTAVVALDPIQTAAFIANPDSGYSPLQVILTNQSTEATDYTWLVNGVPFSNSTNTSYTFADTGTYIIALIAIRNEESCADTAYATIHVDQGLKLIVPNIITPNNDGRNDALVAQTAGVAYMRWEIRNRWGNLLYTDESTRPPGTLTLWSPGSGEVVDGVYTITVTVKGESGELREFASQVSVVGE